MTARSARRLRLWEAEVKYRRAVGQEEIIADFESEKIIGPKYFTAVFWDSKSTVVRSQPIGTEVGLQLELRIDAHDSSCRRRPRSSRSWLLRMQLQDEVIQGI